MGCIVSKLFWIFIYFLYLQSPLATLDSRTACCCFRCLYLSVSAVACATAVLFAASACESSLVYCGLLLLSCPSHNI